MIWPPCSDFWVTTANFSGVWIFRIFTVCSKNTYSSWFSSIHKLFLAQIKRMDPQVFSWYSLLCKEPFSELFIPNKHCIVYHIYSNKCLLSKKPLLHSSFSLGKVFWWQQNWYWIINSFIVAQIHHNLFIILSLGSKPISMLAIQSVLYRE